MPRPDDASLVGEVNSIIETRNEVGPEGREAFAEHLAQIAISKPAVFLELLARVHEAEADDEPHTEH